MPNKPCHVGEVDLADLAGRVTALGLKPTERPVDEDLQSAAGLAPAGGFPESSTFSRPLSP